jgi:hypothetical protein
VRRAWVSLVGLPLALKRQASEIATLRAEMDALKARLDSTAKRAAARR